jgi:hypothetical protein
MAKPSTITQWMQQPAKFNDEDRKTAAALLKAHPYFVPARFMEAAEQQKKNPFSPQMMAMMQLYMGNWLLFYNFIQTANSTKSATNAPTEETAAPEMVSEDEGPEQHSYESQMDIEDIDDPLAGEDEDFNTVDFDSDLDFDSFNDRERDNDEMPELEIDEPFDFDTPEPTIESITKKLDLEKTPEPEKIQETATPSTIQAKTIKVSMPVAKEEPEVEKPEVEEPVEDEPEIKEPFIEEPEVEEKQPEMPKQQATQQKFDKREDSLIQPIYTEDYFLHQGIHISDKVGADGPEKDETRKSLMVVMSFAEWLNYFKTKNEKDKEEQEDQRALKTMWQKEKLAAAMEEENEEIPEDVFEMAVNSITQEEGLASESLADILVKQGKHDKAIEMYRKLSLRNPHKNAYFARRIDEIIKGK